MSFETARRERRRRADGERSRRTILLAAAELATVEGLDGLSIGRLADHIGMSKSGLYAHFGSKEELELATIETAGEIYEADVVGPALREPPGVGRVLALCEAFLSHVERRVFPGGCFFASALAELGPRGPSSPVRARVVAFVAGWYELVERTIREAQDGGEIDGAVDAAQLAFELEALMSMANDSYAATGDAAALERARVGIRTRLGVSR
jgi:AcrR family transcriptional regulator